MEIVAGLSLKNLEPRVWDPESTYYLENLPAIMVSYADFHLMRSRRDTAMELGLRRYLDVPKKVRLYLDNGAFFFASQGETPPFKEYDDFVKKAKPDWRPIPQDYIPSPSMSPQKQRGCFDKTMRVNRSYSHDGFVPVIHIGKHFEQYTSAIVTDSRLQRKPHLALGGIVPNLLRTPKAMSYDKILDALDHAREKLDGKSIHVFGVGGTATVHIAALLGFASVDSSGWRNRAARGIIQLPGSGDRIIANLGGWRGREASGLELKKLRRCRCPACQAFGLKGLRRSGLKGFCNRATHNLWILLNEAEWLERHIANGTYAQNFRRRLDNTVYLPLVKEVLKRLKK